jgi:hypothetical protein
MSFQAPQKHTTFDIPHVKRRGTRTGNGGTNGDSQLRGTNGRDERRDERGQPASRGALKDVTDETGGERQSLLGTERRDTASDRVMGGKPGLMIAARASGAS